MKRRGLNVVDATAPLVIKVSQRDIEKATQADAGECAIAKGCKRLPGVGDVRIGASIAFVDYNDRVERYVLAPEDRKRIDVFDEDGYFKPGEYTLLPPPPEKKIGARVGTKPGSNTRNKKAPGVDRATPRRGRVSAGMFLS